MKRWAGGNPGNPDNVHARARTCTHAGRHVRARGPSLVGSSVDTHVSTVLLAADTRVKAQRGWERRRTAAAYPDPRISPRDWSPRGDERQCRIRRVAADGRGDVPIPGNSEIGARLIFRAVESGTSASRSDVQIQALARAARA